jgi:hypothetical protein
VREESKRLGERALYTFKAVAVGQASAAQRPVLYSRGQPHANDKRAQTRGSSLLWILSGCPKAKRRLGNANAGAPFPRDRIAVRTGRQGILACCEGARRDPELAVSVALRAISPGSALCRPGLVRAGVSVTASHERGVSDPHLAAPFFAPWSSWRGSLTPQYPCHVRPDEQGVSLTVVECAARVALRVRVVPMDCRQL